MVVNPQFSTSLITVSRSCFAPSIGAINHRKFGGGGGYCTPVLSDFQSASTNCNYIYTILNGFCQPPFSLLFITIITHSVIFITLFWSNRALTYHTIYHMSTNFLLKGITVSHFFRPRHLISSTIRSAGKPMRRTILLHIWSLVEMIKNKMTLL